MGVQVLFEILHWHASVSGVVNMRRGVFVPIVAGRDGTVDQRVVIQLISGSLVPAREQDM